MPWKAQNVTIFYADLLFVEIVFSNENICVNMFNIELFKPIFYEKIHHLNRVVFINNFL